MNKIAKQCIPFFAGFIICMIAGTVFLALQGKAASFIFFNRHHFYWLNIFLEYYTYTGDGWFAVFLALLCFFILKKKRLAYSLLCAFLSSGILAQMVKHLLNSPRPTLFFGNTSSQYFIAGIDFAHNNSFPSGHTATAFAVATVLVLNIKNKYAQLPLLSAAWLVAFSRIYLGQHFVLDVLVGALIGVVCGIGSHYLFSKK